MKWNIWVKGNKQKEKTGVLYVMNSRQWLTQPFIFPFATEIWKTLTKPLEKKHRSTAAKFKGHKWTF